MPGASRHDRNHQGSIRKHITCCHRVSAPQRVSYQAPSPMSPASGRDPVQQQNNRINKQPQAIFQVQRDWCSQSICLQERQSQVFTAFLFQPLVAQIISASSLASSEPSKTITSSNCLMPPSLPCARVPSTYKSKASPAGHTARGMRNMLSCAPPIF